MANFISHSCSSQPLSGWYGLVCCISTIREIYLKFCIFDTIVHSMEKALKYIVDDKGTKSSVLISISKWEDLNNKYSKLQKKVSILTGIQKGLKEVRDANKTGKKLQTIKDFLNEGNS